MSSGHKIPMVCRRGDGSLAINEEVLTFLEGLKTPACIVTAIGSPHSGKTTFLSRFFQRSLNIPENSSIEKRIHQNFKVNEKNEEVSEFEMDIWNKPLLLKSGKTDPYVTILLIDTRGPLRKSLTEEHAFLAGINRILTSMQIFNIKDQLNEQDLINLEYFVELGNVMVWNSDLILPGNEKREILFLIRDWVGVQDFQFGIEGGNHYIKQVLSAKEHSHEHKRMRNNVEQFKGGINCFLMQHPSSTSADKTMMKMALRNIQINQETLFAYVTNTAYTRGRGGLSGQELSKLLKGFQRMFDATQRTILLTENPKDYQTLMTSVNRPMFSQFETHVREEFEKMLNGAYIGVENKDFEAQLDNAVSHRANDLDQMVYGDRVDLKALFDKLSWFVKDEKANAMAKFKEKKKEHQRTRELSWEYETRHAKEMYEKVMSKFDGADNSDKERVVEEHNTFVKNVMEKHEVVASSDNQRKILQEHFDEQLQLRLYKLDVETTGKKTQEVNLQLVLRESKKLYKTHMEQGMGLTGSATVTADITKDHQYSLAAAKKHLRSKVDQCFADKMESMLEKSCKEEYEKYIKRSLLLSSTQNHGLSEANERTDQSPISFEVLCGVCFKYMEDVLTKSFSSEATFKEYTDACIEKSMKYLFKEIADVNQEEAQQLFMQFTNFCNQKKIQHYKTDTPPECRSGKMRKESKGYVLEAITSYWQYMYEESKRFPKDCASDTWPTKNSRAIQHGKSMLQDRGGSNDAFRWFDMFCDICGSIYQVDSKIALEDQQEESERHCKSACEAALALYKNIMQEEIPMVHLPVREKDLNIHHRKALFHALGHYRRETLGTHADEAALVEVDLFTCIFAYFTRIRQHNQLHDPTLFGTINPQWAKDQITGVPSAPFTEGHAFRGPLNNLDMTETKTNGNK